MTKALEGVRILDFTRAYSGPYCTMLLGDLGAEVIKVERAGSGDDTRTLFPVKDGKSGYFAYLNRGKKSIALNLKSEAGRNAALEIAKKSDILIENFSPGTMDKLGLGYNDIKSINPDIVYASLSGFGQYGPYSKKPAYDGVVSTMAGLVSLSGTPEQPVRPGPAIADSATGVHCALAVMAAFCYKLRGGHGQYVDVAMMDTVFSMLEGFIPMASMLNMLPERFGNGNASSAPYNMYQTMDGFVAIATANETLFRRLAKLMKREDLIENPKFCENYLRKQNVDELDAIIGSWTAQYTSDVLVAMLDEAKVPGGKMNTVFDLLEDPQIKARNMLIEQEIPGLGTFTFPGNPLKLSLTPPDTSKRAPELGEHAEEILLECGYSDVQIEHMKREGII
ncbi:CoA transferase [Clostridium sp. AM58-1XD]|uniref:CaiB/BaiF CoA transferase family protein n=1 Tax=Clostridium sp. AM58-1XD TaxID=2292307 RepID=UPI000E51FFFE|nr:CoA transferase [Clostridium sp. AM58-1XD]RGY97637.1 CoA transferase [Clostridium sp. AM58-1XD]